MSVCAAIVTKLVEKAFLERELKIMKEVAGRRFF